MKQVFIFFLAYWFSAVVLAYPIGGVVPDKRPKNAPIIQQYEKPEGWYDNALHGVIQPYPASLRFLEEQGNWYTPFNHKGMTGAYDIRNWYHAD